MFPFQYTKNNHFQFGYNGHQQTFRSTPSETWQVSYGQREARKIGSFKEEALRAAQEIGNVHQDLVLCLSGGMDSEVMVRVFKEAGVPFSVITMRYVPTSVRSPINWDNGSDVSRAQNLANELGLNLTFLDVDVPKVFSQEKIDDIFAKSGMRLPGQAVTMHLMEHIQGTPVMGLGDFITMKLMPVYKVMSMLPYPDTDWVVSEHEHIGLAAWIRYLVSINKAAVPGFWAWSPELMYSYLNDPMVHSLITNGMPGKFHIGDIKYEFYSQHWTLERRPILHGFENLTAWANPAVQRLADQIKVTGGDNGYFTSVSSVLSHLEPEAQ